MFDKLIHLLGGYTDHDMIEKFHEGLYAQAKNALNAHTCNDNLVGAAYKNRMRSELSRMVEDTKQLYFNLKHHHH